MFILWHCPTSPTSSHNCFFKFYHLLLSLQLSTVSARKHTLSDDFGLLLICVSVFRHQNHGFIFITFCCFHQPSPQAFTWWGRRDWASGRRKRKRKGTEVKVFMGGGGCQGYLGQTREKGSKEWRRAIELSCSLKSEKLQVLFYYLDWYNVCILSWFCMSNYSFHNPGVSIVRTLSSAEILMSVSPSIKMVTKKKTNFFGFPWAWLRIPDILQSKIAGPSGAEQYEPLEAQLLLNIML